jgi:hypothetical protein
MHIYMKSIIDFGNTEICVNYKMLRNRIYETYTKLNTLIVQKQQIIKLNPMVMSINLVILLRCVYFFAL